MLFQRWRHGTGQSGVEHHRLADIFSNQAPRAACEHVGHTDIGVKDFAGARVLMRWSNGKADVGTGEPTDGRMPRVHGIESILVGLLFGDDSVLEANLFERFVPFKNAGLNGLAILDRNILVEPEHNWLLGFGYSGRRIRFLQPPAVDQMLLGLGRGVLIVVDPCADEVADTLISDTRCHRLVGQLGE